MKNFSFLLMIFRADKRTKLLDSSLRLLVKHSFKISLLREQTKRLNIFLNSLSFQTRTSYYSASLANHEYKIQATRDCLVVSSIKARSRPAHLVNKQRLNTFQSSLRFQTKLK